MTGRYGTQDAAHRRADMLRYRGVPAALHAIIREARTAEQLIEHPFRHHTSAAPAAAAVTIEPTTGGPVSNLLDEIEADVKDFATATAAKFQAVDKAALAAVEAVKADPVRYSIFVSLASSAHVPDPAGILGSIDNLLKAFAEPAPSFTPAGPQVAGQA